ncbi:MAG: hypothetical protein ACXAC5_04570 [Promethearchaeota archaeon]|jgi:hypothetical protein
MVSGRRRDNKTVNVKGFFSWVYSLFGIWWFTIVPAFVFICLIGSFRTLFLGILCIASFVMWVKTGEDRMDKAKGFLGSIVSHVKEWWAKRPSLTE